MEENLKINRSQFVYLPLQIFSFVIGNGGEFNLHNVVCRTLTVAGSNMLTAPFRFSNNSVANLLNITIVPDFDSNGTGIDTSGLTGSLIYCEGSKLNVSNINVIDLNAINPNQAAIVCYNDDLSINTRTSGNSYLGTLVRSYNCKIKIRCNIIPDSIKIWIK